MAKLEPGMNAPEFELLDQCENTVKLSDFKGKNVLIYFYPKASTPGCTTQSCCVRDAKEDFAGKNTVVLGVSPDEPAKQQNFDDKQQLGFPLLCDTDHAVAEAFGVWGEKNMYGKKYMGIIRSSFLIDEAGVVIQAWYKVKPKDTVPNAMAEL